MWSLDYFFSWFYRCVVFCNTPLSATWEPECFPNSQNLWHWQPPEWSLWMQTKWMSTPYFQLNNDCFKKHTIGALPLQRWIDTPKKPAQDSSRLGNLICAHSRIAAHITEVLWSSSARQLRDSSTIVAVTLERILSSRSFSCHPQG